MGGRGGHSCTLPHAGACEKVLEAQLPPTPTPTPPRTAHHVVARQQLLQELRLLVHDSLDDELVIAGDIEDGATGTGVGELDEWLVAQRVLRAEQRLEA